MASNSKTIKAHWVFCLLSQPTILCEMMLLYAALCSGDCWLTKLPQHTSRFVGYLRAALWRKFRKSSWHLVRLSQSKSNVIILCRGSDESETIFVSFVETIRVPLSLLVDMKITAIVWKCQAHVSFCTSQCDPSWLADEIEPRYEGMNLHTESQ